ncbi:MAG: glycosyltransferase [Ignavibacteria bacterium]
MRPIYFVASARDYHAVDWYRLVKQLCPARRVGIVTDLIEGEGFERIVDASDEVILLFPLDKVLLPGQSRLGNLWRNLVKLAFVPLLAWRLRMLAKRAAQPPVFHAHSMYYIFLCWMAGIEFVGTPMGSDVLVRPDHSRLYRLFTRRSLRAAAAITVDSVALRDKIRSLCQRDSFIVQNGIDAAGTRPAREAAGPRNRIVSIRGVDPNYRIAELVQARNTARNKLPLELIYPFFEEGYLREVKAGLTAADVDHGRVGKNEMYRLFSQARLVVSIPISDSSPRSVYEAIFCGACVVVSKGKWIEALPDCMRQRIVVADLDSDHWFDDALREAEAISKSPFVPSLDAIQMFDETECMKAVCRNFYGEVFDA